VPRQGPGGCYCRRRPRCGGPLEATPTRSVRWCGHAATHADRGPRAGHPVLGEALSARSVQSGPGPGGWRTLESRPTHLPPRPCTEWRCRPHSPLSQLEWRPTLSSRLLDAGQGGGAFIWRVVCLCHQHVRRWRGRPRLRGDDPQPIAAARGARRESGTLPIFGAASVSPPSNWTVASRLGRPRRQGPAVVAATVARSYEQPSVTGSRRRDLQLTRRGFFSSVACPLYLLPLLPPTLPLPSCYHD